MRIEDIIYFSPTLKLEDLDTQNKDLVIEFFEERIKSYYFTPISILIEKKFAFASGALECLLIDAFARYSSNDDGVESRIVDWCQSNLKVDKKTATEFYKFFRCGLLHESHIKSFGQFCFDEHPADRALKRMKDFIIVNPRHLFTELENFLHSFIQELKNNSELYDVFLERINLDFKNEVETAGKEKSNTTD